MEYNHSQPRSLVGARHSRHRLSWLLLLLAMICAGCVHPISENWRREVDPSLTFAQVFQSPEAHVGVKIVLGGVIVKTNNFPDRAEIEVVQREINSYGNLVESDVSGGRFIFVKQGYVEPEIYAKGRELTGAGKIVGAKTGKVDDREYRYPLVEIEELHLWEKKDTYRFNDPYWNSPYYYGYPWRRSPFYW